MKIFTVFCVFLLPIFAKEQGLLDSVKKLQLEVTEVKYENNKIQSVFAKMMSENADLIAENGKMKSEIDELAYDISEMKEENLALKSNIEELDNKNNQLKSEVLELKSKTEQESKVIREMNGQEILRNIPANFQNNNAVSFTGYVSTGYVFYPLGQTIIFDGVLSNYGNGYNPANGIFICPVTAFYLFTVSINSYFEEGGFSAKIVMGTESLVAVNGVLFNGMSNSVVILCEQGSPVFVQSIFPNSLVYGTEDVKLSTFSGTLLFLAT